MLLWVIWDLRKDVVSAETSNDDRTVEEEYQSQNSYSADRSGDRIRNFNFSIFNMFDVIIDEKALFSLK